jgi:hypothetical protein
MASGQTLAVWGPQANQPPASNFAQLGAVNNHPTLDFDPNTNWSAVFGGILNRAYSGGGVTLTLWYLMASATSGNVGFQGAFERFQSGTTNLTSDNFASSPGTVSSAVPGTAGIVKSVALTFSDGAQMGSLAAGEGFRIKITRDTATSGNATGNARILRAELKET